MFSCTDGWHVTLLSTFTMKPIKILSIMATWRGLFSPCTSRVGMRCMWTMHRRSQTPVPASPHGASAQAIRPHGIRSQRSPAADAPHTLWKVIVSHFLFNEWRWPNRKSKNTKLFSKTARGYPAVRHHTRPESTDNKDEEQNSRQPWNQDRVWTVNDWKKNHI